MTTSCRVHANVVLCTCDLSGTVNLSRKLFFLIWTVGLFLLFCVSRFSFLPFFFFLRVCMRAVTLALLLNCPLQRL